MDNEVSIERKLKVPDTLLALLSSITGKEDHQEAIETFAAGCVFNFIEPQDAIDALNDVQKKLQVNK